MVVVTIITAVFVASWGPMDVSRGEKKKLIFKKLWEKIRLLGLLGAHGCE